MGDCSGNGVGNVKVRFIQALIIFQHPSVCVGRSRVCFGSRDVKWRGRIVLVSRSRKLMLWKFILLVVVAPVAIFAPPSSFYLFLIALPFLFREARAPFLPEGRESSDPDRPLVGE